MTALSDLQPEDRGLLVGLLYRAGVWMSHADDEHGEADDRREMKALAHIIKSIAKVHESSAFVQDAARETLAHHEQWPSWAEHAFDILADCEKAYATLKFTVTDDDRKDYCQTLLHIAETVAAAYGEFGQGADDDEETLAGFLGKVVGRLKGEEQDSGFMNISPAEEDALERLRVALHMDE